MSASLLKLAVFKDVGFMDAGYHQNLAFCPPEFPISTVQSGHDQKPKTEHTYPDRQSPRRVPHDQATRLPGPYWDHRNSKRVILHHEPRPIVGFFRDISVTQRESSQDCVGYMKIVRCHFLVLHL